MHQTAILTTAYVTSLFLEKQCGNAQTFQELHCNSTFQGPACTASKIKEITTCFGDAAVNVAMVYQAAKTTGNAIKTAKLAGKK